MSHKRRKNLTFYQHPASPVLSMRSLNDDERDEADRMADEQVRRYSATDKTVDYAGIRLTDIRFTQTAMPTALASRVNIIRGVYDYRHGHELIFTPVEDALFHGVWIPTIGNIPVANMGKRQLKAWTEYHYVLSRLHLSLPITHLADIQQMWASFCPECHAEHATPTGVLGSDGF